MYNYSKTDLERIASGTDFIRDNLEKVFRLCDVLKHLNENPLSAEHLALKGGTAINLTIFDLPHLSVDIDLDFTKECSRDELMIFTEEEKSFIENFNSNVYRPKLLFEDIEIVERIKKHPMEIWKITNSK